MRAAVFLPQTPPPGETLPHSPQTRCHHRHIQTHIFLLHTQIRN